MALSYPYKWISHKRIFVLCYTIFGDRIQWYSGRISKWSLLSQRNYHKNNHALEKNFSSRLKSLEESIVLIISFVFSHSSVVRTVSPFCPRHFSLVRFSLSLFFSLSHSQLTLLNTYTDTYTRAT